MMLLYPLMLIVAFTGMVFTEVFDLGDLKQYEAKIDVLPDGIQVDSIWITQVDGGFNVVLGQGIKAKVDGVLDGCGDPNDHCHQDVARVLEDAILQTDKNLESRQVIAGIFAIVRIWKAFKRLKEAIAILSLAVWIANKQHGNEKGNFWPEYTAISAANLPEATPITVSAGASAVVTITQAPDPTVSLEGSITPGVTVVTSAVDGFENGDLAGILDKGLADRLNEFMQRTKNCQAGSEFDQQHPAATSARKRAGGGSYGQALCASQAVIGGVQAGGPWNNLLLLNPAGVHFQFAQAAGPALDAANQFADFVHTYAPLMAVPTDLIEQLGTYVFALAMDAIVESVPLGEKNRIKATMVTTSASPTGTSEPGCPDKNSLICGLTDEEDCSMKITGDGDARKSVCEDGEHKDCECTAPSYVAIDLASPERQKSLQSFKDLFAKGSTSPAPDAHPECPIVVTEIPGALFSNETMNIRNHFCDGWFKENKTTMTVDSKGANALVPDPHLQAVTKRTPPPNPGGYSNFRFDLGFTPSPRGGECKQDCKGAFSQFANVCAASSPGIFMYEKGSYDVGCGTFEYKIYNPFTKLTEFPRFCYKPEDLAPVRGDVRDGDVSFGTILPCVGRGLPENIIKKGDKSTFVQNLTHNGNVPYQYNIWWKDGCTLANNGPTWVYAADPLMQGKAAGYTKCQDTLWHNWKDCVNGGIGGNVQLGCLVFEFVASDNKRIF